VFRNVNFTTHYRSTYTGLELIGDLGGFIEGWMFLGIIFVSQYSWIEAAEAFMQKAFYTTK
jgi:hypothetical protein